MQHHLAILYPTYIQMIAEGVKTIECRLSRYRIPPFGDVSAGDIVWLKESCGPVRLVAEVAKVRSRVVKSVADLEHLRKTFNDRVRAEPDFWRAKRDVAYCTLIWLGDVQAVEPFRVNKTDRRAWVVLDGALEPGQVFHSPHRDVG
jgi:ASC-1-like (ASCH) protein